VISFTFTSSDPKCPQTARLHWDWPRKGAEGAKKQPWAALGLLRLSAAISTRIDVNKNETVHHALGFGGADLEPIGTLERHTSNVFGGSNRRRHDTCEPESGLKTGSNAEKRQRFTPRLLNTNIMTRRHHAPSDLPSSCPEEAYERQCSASRRSRHLTMTGREPNKSDPFVAGRRVGAPDSKGR